MRRLCAADRPPVTSCGPARARTQERGVPVADKPSTLRELADNDPDRHDVYIALVAPLGASTEHVLATLSAVLDGQYGYQVNHVQLSLLLDDIVGLSTGILPRRGEPHYHKRRMNAGDELRRMAGDDSALAALAIAKIAATKTTGPTAHVLVSLKHPREAALLKKVYGSALWLVSVVQDSDERLANLANQLGEASGSFEPAPESAATLLMARDEADEDARHGQHVRDVFSAADFFLPVRQGVPLTPTVERFLSGVFGAPFLSPRLEEEAMRHAQAAALRSAAVGRQVGAVTIPPGGTPYVLGTNEVPKPGGGQYREGDQPDHRDFQGGVDPNPAYTQRVLREVMDRLASGGYFTQERNEAGGAAVLREALAPDADGKAVLDGTRARALIEFTRCLHAEQASIANAARSGTSIGGGRLFSTTFPCHECAKFIIGAGIVEVQYIEPYPKSLVRELYRDLIDARPPLDAVGNDDEILSRGRVPFRPFLGFAPTRYDEVFVAKARRTQGRVSQHTPRSAYPVGLGWSRSAVETAQDEVVVAVAAIVQEIGLSAIKTTPSERVDDSQEADSDAAVPNVEETG